MNVKVSNLISRNNETRYIKWHESWKWKCRLDGNAFNNKQIQNEDKCRCECEELIDNMGYRILLKSEQLWIWMW